MYVTRTLSDRMQGSVASRSEASVCDQSLAGIACSNPTQGRGCLSLVIFVCYQGEVSASG